MQRHPTPAEPAEAETTHTLVIRSDRALTISARTDDEARGRYWRELVTSKVITQLTIADVRIMSALASLVNGEHFRASGGELVAWPGESYLMSLAGVGRAILWRSIGRLVTIHDLIERIELERGTTRWAAWRLKVPQLPAPTGVDVRGAGSARARRRSSLQARALAPTGVGAPTLNPSIDSACAPTTTKIEPQRATPAGCAREDNEDRAAPGRGLFGSAEDGDDGSAGGGIVDRLAAVGVSRRQASRLAPLTTPGIVGRVLAAADGRELDNAPGWIVYMIEHPEEIPRLRRGKKDGGSRSAATGEGEERKKRAAAAAELAQITATVKGNAARCAGLTPAAAAAAIAAAAAKLHPGAGALRTKLERVTQAQLAAGKWPSVAAAIVAGQAAAELAPA